MSWAFAQSQLKTPERFCLVSLADEANNEGVCWPSLRRLVERTGYSERRVIYAMRSLERDGLVEVLPRRGRTGRQTSSVYVLHMEHGRSMQDIGRRADRDAAYHSTLPRIPSPPPSPVDNPVDNSDDAGGQTAPRASPPCTTCTPGSCTTCTPGSCIRSKEGAREGKPPVETSGGSGKKILKESASLPTDSRITRQEAQERRKHAAATNARLQSERPSRTSQRSERPARPHGEHGKIGRSDEQREALIARAQQARVKAGIGTVRKRLPYDPSDRSPV